ncbi:MAG: hypothetical protein ACRC62_07560 [Microcoleus sp.]
MGNGELSQSTNLPIEQFQIYQSPDRTISQLNNLPIEQSPNLKSKI